MDDNIIDFIKRRFIKDCDWISGNCYYFAIILKARFKNSEIYYDVIDGHFFIKYRRKFYDWTGEIYPNTDHIIKWDDFDKYDTLVKSRIIRDCIL